MNQILLHCRPGFEKECAAEIQALANAAGFFGYAKTQPGRAYVLYVTQDPEAAGQVILHLSFRDLVFARQWFLTAEPLRNLPPRDRVTPLLERAKILPACRSLVVETPDTNEGKELSTLGRKLTAPLVSALKGACCLSETGDWQLHLMLVSGQCAYLGISPVHNRAAWPMGIPRLRQPRGAPSRATLKLEEAWHHFIPAQDWEYLLAPGQKAVDLGAAPGGWTWQLVNRGFWVDAVDNGPMDEALMASGQVQHWREDGFSFQPRRPVDWLVCDIADRPARVAHLIARWLGQGYCREAIFNLKLPMKQRYAELEKLRERMQTDLAGQGVKAGLAFKQLYHDREEVTGHLFRLS